MNEVPLSVCIVDMDWHITNTGNASSGWTGYTWNRELFPDPKRFLEGLHERGLITALNLHPATGIFPHEEQYQAMADHMGVDPDTNSPIPFSIADPHFHAVILRSYIIRRKRTGLIFGGWIGSRARLRGYPG